MLPTGNDYLAAWHAVVWLGAIEVPVNVEYRGSFLEHILRDSGATVLSSTTMAAPVSARSSSPDIRHLVVVGGGTVPRRDARRDRRARVRGLLASRPRARVTPSE